jgi:hypothetical protein
MSTHLPTKVRNHQVVARNSARHRAWALEAARLAQRVLRLFAEDRPNDHRPREAIRAIRAWAQGRRQLSMGEVRRLSLGAHAAARGASTDVARFAARAAGHAVATWHVPTHAIAVPWYAGKAIMAAKSR